MPFAGALVLARLAYNKDLTLCARSRIGDRLETASFHPEACGRSNRVDPRNAFRKRTYKPGFLNCAGDRRCFDLVQRMSSLKGEQDQYFALSGQKGFKSLADDRPRTMNFRAAQVEWLRAHGETLSVACHE